MGPERLFTLFRARYNASVTHVFISHASENREEANQLVALIEAKGMTAWIAPRDVRPGFDYSEELQRALETCTAFVVLVTAEANVSPYVRAETEMAFSNQKPMLPVRLADIAAGPGLAFFLKIRHWTDAWGPNRDAALARLVLELQTLTGTAPSWAPKAGTAADAPAPPPPPAPPPAPVPGPPQPAAPPPLAILTDPAAAAATAPNRGRGVIIGLVAAAVLVGGLYVLTRPAPLPPPHVNDFTPVPPPPAPTPTPPPVQQRGYADELTDFGVAPKSELEANVGSPTPLAIPVGVRVTTDEVQRLTADNRAVLVDVLATPHGETLPGAFFMPAGGTSGSFYDDNQTQFARQLSQATGGDTSRPLIFFCQGANCWESYNAALRANAAGYRQIYWYRGGLAAWQEAGLAMQSLPAAAGN